MLDAGLSTSHHRARSNQATQLEVQIVPPLGIDVFIQRAVPHGVVIEVVGDAERRRKGQLRQQLWQGHSRDAGRLKVIFLHGLRTQRGQNSIQQHNHFHQRCHRAGRRQ